MGVIFTDSYDHYLTTNVAQVYNGTSPLNASITTAAARTGTLGLRLSSGASTTSLGFVALILPSNYASLYVGFALKIESMPTGSTPATILSFSSATSSSSIGVDVQLTPAGALRFLDNTGGFAGNHDNWTGTALTTGTWYYVEVKYKVTASTATGDCEIRVDYGTGPTVVNQIAASRQTYVSQANVKYVCFGDIDTRGTWTTNSACLDIDDVYILDPSTGTNTGYLGNCKVEVIKPAAAGASNQWTPLSGSNYSNVNEATMDGNTTYNSTTGVGNRDSFAVGTMSGTPTSIFAVRSTLWAEDDTGGSTHTIGASIRSGGTYYDGTAATVNANVYRPYGNFVWETNPANGSAWTRSAVEGVEAGYKLVS